MLNAYLYTQSLANLTVKLIQKHEHVRTVSIRDIKDNRLHTATHTIRLQYSNTHSQKTGQPLWKYIKR